MKYNPPVKGHSLLNEGHMRGSAYYGDVTAVGGCACGYQPIGWRSMALNKVKRWHREHKEAVRSGRPAPAVGLDLRLPAEPEPVSGPRPKTAAEWLRQPFQ